MACDLICIFIVNIMVMNSMMNNKFSKQCNYVMQIMLRSPPPCQISPPSVQRVAPAGRKTSKSASE